MDVANLSTVIPRVKSLISNTRSEKRLAQSANAMQNAEQSFICHSKRYVLQHLHCAFPSNRDDYVAQGLRVEASFAVGEIILIRVLAVYSSHCKRISIVAELDGLTSHFRLNSSTSLSVMPLCSSSNAGLTLASKLRWKLSFQSLNVFA